MKISLFGFLLALSSLLASSAAAQPQYEATAPSIIDAIARGEAKEALAAMEAKALEAEKNAASSASPQQYWVEASNAYREAASFPSPFSGPPMGLAENHRKNGHPEHP